MTREDVLKKLETQIAQLNKQFQIIRESEQKIPKLEMDRMLSDIRATYELFTVLNYHNTYGNLPATQIRQAEIPAEQEQPPVAEKQPEPVIIKTPEPVIPPEPEKKETPQPLAEPVITEKILPAEKEITPPVTKPVSEPLKEILADKFRQNKVDDLKKAIPLHEKFLYINELFQGDNGPYNEFIEMLNSRTTWEEAETIMAHAIARYNWDTDSKTFIKFFELIHRKF